MQFCTDVISSYKYIIIHI